MADPKVRLQIEGPDGLEPIDLDGDGLSAWRYKATWDRSSRHIVHSIQVAVNLLESYGIDVPLFHLEVKTGDEVLELYRGEGGKLKLNEKGEAAV